MREDGRGEPDCREKVYEAIGGSWLRAFRATYGFARSNGQEGLGR